MDIDENLDEVIEDAYSLRDDLYAWWLREKSRGVPLLTGGDCRTFFDVFIVFVIVCVLLYVMTMIMAGVATAGALIPSATRKIQLMFSSVSNITDIQKNVDELVTEIVLAKKHIDIASLTPLMATGRLASSYITILATNGATQFIETHSLFKKNSTTKDVGKRVVKFVRAKAFTILTFTVGSVGVYPEFNAFLTVMNLVCSIFPSTFWKEPEVNVKFSSKVSESDASEASDPRSPDAFKLKFMRRRGFVPRPSLMNPRLAVFKPYTTL